MKRTGRPRISVLLPFHNAAKTLVEALDSIAAQTFSAYEVLAVDDGSVDGSGELVARRSHSDPRLRLLQPGRVGFVPALNLGLAAARAPLIARMDADDRMHPERLAVQSAFLERSPGIDLVGTRVRLFPHSAIRAGLRAYGEWQDRCITPEAIAQEIYVESPIPHPSMMYRLRTVDALGGYREGPFPEDYELLLRLNHAGRRMAKIDRVLLEWRDGPERLSRTDPRCSRRAFDRLRAAYLDCDPRLRSGRPLAFWGAGRKTRRRVDHLLEYGHRPCAWIDVDPRKIGNRLDGVPVVAPSWLHRREPRPFVLGYVASHGARDRIAAELEAMDYRAGEDYLMVG